MNQHEQAQPHNLDAERAILGAILVDNEALLHVRDEIEPRTFFRDAHRKTYEAMLELARRGARIDLVTVTNLLDERRILDDVGGPAYVATFVDGVPRATNVTNYASIVREKSARRDLIATANKLLALAHDATPIEDIFEQADQAMVSLSRAYAGHDGFLDAAAVVNTTAKKLAERAEHPNAVTGLPSGRHVLDVVTTGFQNGEMTVIGGRPGMGKSAFALDVSLQSALDARPDSIVAYCSFEMSKEALMERAFANTARINLTTIRTGRGYGKPEYSRLTDAMAKIARSHLHIDDSRGIAFAVVKSRLRRLASKGRIACVIIDYHQRVNTDGVRGDTRDQVLTRVAEGFRNLAQEFDAPVILLAALNREVEKGTKRHPQLSDLRECGGLEAEADTVIFIHRPEVYDANAAPGLAEFVIAKQRQGEIGVVKLRYVAAQVRFEDWVESRT